jgi:hypothetical protein
MKVEIGVSYGCLPLGLEKTITRARGKTVYQIDGQPVWDFFKQYLDEKSTKFSHELDTFLDSESGIYSDISVSTKRQSGFSFFAFSHASRPVSTAVPACA